VKASNSSVQLALLGSRDDHAQRSGDDDRDQIDDAFSEEIEIVVSHIKRLTREAPLEYALRIGVVIIHHFYGGDTTAWRLRGPKTTSFRRLAQHPELPLSPGALYRCVALFELCERLNAASRWDKLTVSHLRLVLALPPAEQEGLLSKANSGRWTVKMLQAQVLRKRWNAQRSSGGRRPEPPVKKSLKAITKCLKEYNETMASLEEFPRDEVAESIRLVNEAKRLIDRLSATLSSISSANV